MAPMVGGSHVVRDVSTPAKMQAGRVWGLLGCTWAGCLAAKSVAGGPGSTYHSSEPAAAGAAQGTVPQAERLLRQLECCSWRPQRAAVLLVGGPRRARHHRTIQAADADWANLYQVAFRLSRSRWMCSEEDFGRYSLERFSKYHPVLDSAAAFHSI